MLGFLFTLSATAQLGWEAALAWIDNRAGYGRARMVDLALIEGILYFEAFADRETAARIHCLRRSNRSEVCDYVKAIQEIQPEDAVT